MDFSKLNSSIFAGPLVAQLTNQFKYRESQGDPGVEFAAIRKTLRRWNSQDRVLSEVRALIFPADSVEFVPRVGHYIEGPGGELSRVMSLDVDAAGLNYTVGMEAI